MVRIDTAHFLKNFDYSLLVKQMAQAGEENMELVLREALSGFPVLTYESERCYFWMALHNAAKQNDIVWLWVITRKPSLDKSNGVCANPSLVPDWELPEIGGAGEEPLNLEEEALLAEPTEDNFRDQAEALEELMKKTAKPESRCHNVKEYVDTFRHSGSATIAAKLCFAANGFPAFATDQGIAWLIENY